MPRGNEIVNPITSGIAIEIDAPKTTQTHPLRRKFVFANWTKISPPNDLSFSMLQRWLRQHEPLCQ